MLYLNSNGLTHIEGLQHCKNLEYLNIVRSVQEANQEWYRFQSNNRIRTVMNLEELTSLKTLIVANNHICNIASDLSPGISQVMMIMMVL